METGRCPSCRKLFAWIGVLCVHAVLMALFVRPGIPRDAARHRDSEPPLVVFLLERPAPQQVQPPSAPSAARAHTSTRSHRTRPPPDTSTSQSLEPPSPSHSVDWYREAELEGFRRALATPSGAHAGEPGTVSRACKTRPQAHWEPEPKRVGLAGGIVPYVRIGPCAIGLAIFGCAFGHPQANGHLLDAARDPDSDALDGPDCAP